MRSWLCFGLLFAFSLAADPITLHVDVKESKYLSFRLENHYPSPVTRFEVHADFGTDNNLGCGVIAEVNRPEDLRPPATCSLPIDNKTGKVADPNWKARIVSVEFADGTRWSPKR